MAGNGLSRWPGATSCYAAVHGLAFIGSLAYRLTMLFAKKDRKLRRVLVVEDEPLVAFDNEYALDEAGYQVVGTVDTAAAAIDLIAQDPPPDIVLCDVTIAGGSSGMDVARAALDKGIKVLFVTASCPLEAQALAVGCLAKPYGPRDLPDALAAIEAALGGKRSRRLPSSLSLYIGPGR
jgi:CheY-like chemotaxis protein